MGTRRGIISYILPYIEQGNIARIYSTETEWFAPDNRTAIAVQLGVFMCPSAPGPRSSSGIADGVNWTAGCSDYGVMQGLDSSTHLMGIPLDYPKQGMFRDREPTRLANCTDGLSNILMIAEDAGRPQYWKAGRQFGDMANPEMGVWASRQFKIQPRGHLLDGSGFPGPCAVNCSNDRGVYAFHPGVANVCMGDGSVRTLRKELNIFVFYYLCTIQGGELVAPDQY